MKEMIRFSLFRRFHNRSTKLFNILLFGVIALLAFSDCILSWIAPSMLEKETIYTVQIEEELRTFLNENAKEEYVFEVLDGKEKSKVEEGYTILKQKKEGYELFSKYELSPVETASFQSHLQMYEQQKWIQAKQTDEETYPVQVTVKNNVLEKNIDLSQEKTTLLFVFVTSVYFMMLSFVSGVASEVIHEKTTKTLELILTSVSAKTHFYAKLIVGWLVIVIQGMLSGSYVLFWLLARSLYDQGAGLVFLLKKMHILSLEGDNFYAVLLHFDFSISFFQKLGWIIVFLLLGILLIQLVMVIVSSFIASIEEAGNIQAPFYLLLLGFYYVTLAINDPQKLSEGIGFYLSFVPFMNMLIMPCRLLIQDVALLQLLLSAGMSVFLLRFILKHGGKVYEQGVLDYTCKGFLQVLKSIVAKRS